MLKNPDGPLPRMNALRAFEAAARHESFASAAAELGLKQPAVSRLVAGLERETGIRLFERTGRAVSLTPAGDVYRRGVAVGLERIAAARVMVSDLAKDGRVTIACGGSTSEMFLRPRLGDLQHGLARDMPYCPQANAESAMPNSSDGSLPRMAALRAFDAVVRHASFTRAAEELGIRQPAVSRYIAELERDLDTRLLERSGRTASLTPAGEAYHLAVVLGLDRITAVARAAESLVEDQHVTVSCSHEASHFLVMPHYADLRHALGEDIQIRVLTRHHSVGGLSADPAADIRLTWDPAGTRSEDRAAILSEEVRPVCSPTYAAAHAGTLAGPAAGWSELALLDLMQPNEGWATWEDWFAVTGRPDWPPRRIEIGSYVDVLEAAVAGRGVALGWHRFVERFLEVGTLVALGDRFVGFDRTFYGVLTERGRRKPLARRCLDFLADGTADATRA